MSAFPPAESGRNIYDFARQTITNPEEIVFLWSQVNNLVDGDVTFASFRQLDNEASRLLLRIQSLLERNPNDMQLQSLCRFLISQITDAQFEQKLELLDRTAAPTPNQVPTS